MIFLTFYNADSTEIAKTTTSSRSLPLSARYAAALPASLQLGLLHGTLEKLNDILIHYVSKPLSAVA